MWLSAYQTAINPKDVSLLAYVDDDDESPYDGTLIRGPRIGLGPAYNRLYMETDADIVMLCADDVVFRTKGWDMEVRELMPDDLVGVVSYDDLGRPRKENGHPFVGRKFIELMGYLCYPRLGHSCVDNWLVDTARAVNRFFYGEMVIEHLHPKYQKGEVDQTYLDNSKDKKQADGLIYLGYEGQREISGGVQRLRHYLEQTESRCKD